MYSIEVVVLVGVGSFLIGLLWANFVFRRYYRKNLEINTNVYIEQYQEDFSELIDMVLWFFECRKFIKFLQAHPEYDIMASDMVREAYNNYYFATGDLLNKIDKIRKDNKT